jgi:heptosyltransferase III
MAMAEKRNVLILQSHNLGDAVISTALVETIACGLPTARIDVLTRPEISQIFALNPHVNRVFIGRFPMGSANDFGIREMLALPRLVGMLRGQKYTDVVNLAGDFREEFLGRLVSARDNWTPAWSVDHPCSKVIRRSAIRLANQPVFIPLNLPNIYEAAAIVGTAVSGGEAQPSALYTPAKRKMTWSPTERVVGIHPMASQPWRKWDMEKWQNLAKILIKCEIDVHVFGAPTDAEELNKYFGRLGTSRVKIVTGGLPDYFAAVSQVRILLCLDSFASHVAFALGVPTILLNGANDSAAWAPPGAVVVAAGPGMKCYPCYNRPTCFNSSTEYACIRDIAIDSVVEAVWNALESSPSDRHLFPLLAHPAEHR